MIENIYPMFASPAIPTDTDIATAVALSYTRNILSRAVLSLNVEQQWFGILVEAWQQQSHNLHDLWQPAFSVIEQKLNHHQALENIDLINAALVMRRSFDIPPPLVVSDLCLLPEVREKSNVIPLRHEVLINTEGNVQERVLPYAVSAEGWESKLWLDACSLLDEVSPGYAVWSQYLLSAVVPLDAPQGYQISASHWHRRGEVMMSWRLRPEQLAEILVHEASHQHFFMAGMLSPYDDGSDQSLYYSPVVKTERPLAKILLAYHAFANVILFFRLAREHLSGGGQHWLDRESKKVLEELDQLEKPLRSSHALTPLGNSLWQPLASQLKETV